MHVMGALLCASDATIHLRAVRDTVHLGFSGRLWY